jgi:hypothetical protein
MLALSHILLPSLNESTLFATKELQSILQNCEQEKIPLSKLWNGIHNHANIFIAHAILRLDVVGDVYWEGVDRHYFGKEVEARVKLFYEVLATSDQNKVIARKPRDLETYNAKLKERGLEEDRPLEPLPGLPADKRSNWLSF